jgi:hypothetical protein
MSNSWLPKALRWMFTFFVVITALGAIAVAVVMVIDPKLPPNIHFGPTKVFIQHEPAIVAIAPENGDLRLDLTAFRGTVHMSMDHGGGFIELLKHDGLPLVLLNILFLTALFELLRRLFRNVGRGESFTPHTLRLVQILGFGLLVFSLVAAAGEGWFNGAVQTYLAQHTAITISGVALHVPPSETLHFSGGNFPFGTPLFFSGLLVLALSEVFRQGLMLKRENDLTV